MSHTILLYGATGYSGRLIAAEARRAGMSNSAEAPGNRMVLAARDHRALAALARDLEMEPRAFGLENRDEVVRQLTGVDLVINAAGPFALTGNHLAKGALAAGCHYVDINGEAEVYLRMDDLGRFATQRNLAMVCSAGHSAAASDILLDVALRELRTAAADRPAGGSRVRHPQPYYTAAATANDSGRRDEVGAIRIAMSRVTTLSRGSAETLWRSLREQVRVVRQGVVSQADGNFGIGPVLWHEPVGKLERAFDFLDPDDVDRSGDTRAAVGRPRNERARDLRIATACNLVDTLTARLTVERLGFAARCIESYVEAGPAARLAYQAGPLLAPLAALPWARDIARLQLDALPTGPTPGERANQPHFVVLQIDDLFQSPIVDWGWRTPNPYDFTAAIVIELATRLLTSNLSGWLTPSEVLQPTRNQLSGGAAYLRGCTLNDRRVHVSEVVP